VVAALVLVSFVAILPAAVYTQQFTAGILFIEDSVDRLILGWPLPASSFPALDGFYCILVVPPLIALWQWQAKRGREPGDMGKIVIAYLIFAAANLLMILPASFADAGAKVGLVWPLASFLLNAIAFIYYWPTLLALFSRAAPAQVTATMMGVLFASTFVGNTLSGTLAGLWEGMSHARFYALHAALALGPMLAMLLIARPMTRLLASSAQ
jgi:POT family proton-dependent oligopeptide transporter